MSEPNHCPNCNATLAGDQRYCLNCGRRLSPPRVDWGSELGLEPASHPSAAPRSAWDSRGPLMTLAAGAAVLLALGVGVVLGRGNGSAAPRSQVVTVAGGAPAASASGGAQNVSSISDDWPSRASGYTVELSSIDKSGATAASVASAKAAASSKGAPKIGALNGDAHSGTPTGKYVIYSGRYATKAQAQAAAKKLKNSFPNTIILHVTPGGSGSGSGSGKGSGSGGGGGGGANVNTNALNTLAGKTGAAYVKAASKLPSQVGTGGKPPPKDNKKPGGGTGGACIGC